MGIHAADAKFIVASGLGRGKTVAFAGLKADEPREAKRAGHPSRFGRGQSGRTDTHV
jgi:hypothetical protein